MTVSFDFLTKSQILKSLRFSFYTKVEKDDSLCTLSSPVLAALKDVCRISTIPPLQQRRWCSIRKNFQFSTLDNTILEN